VLARISSRVRADPLPASTRAAASAAGVPHAPAVHTSPTVQALPSSHGVPSGTGVVSQPRVGSQLATAHVPGSGQTTGSVAHCPASQRAFVWHASATVQSASLVQHEASGACVQRRAPSSHASVVHALPSSHAGGDPATHAPARQVSAPLQKRPSEHAVPSAAAAWTQRPALHASVVHAFPSSHCAALVQAVQPAIGVWMHPPVSLHESAVHALPSSHDGATPAVQTPARHVSTPLQERPSLHDVPSATRPCAQRPALQTSVVHGFPSLHCAALVHAAQPAIATWVQPVAGLHASVVQAFVARDLRARAAVRVHGGAARGALARVPAVRHAVAVRIGAVGIGLARVDHAVEVAVLRRVGEPVAVRVDHRRDLRVREHDLVRVRAVDAVRVVRGHDDTVCRADVEPGHDGRERAIRRRDGQPRVEREGERVAGSPRVDAIPGHRRVRGRAPVRAHGVRCRRGAAREDDPARQHPPHHPPSRPHDRA